jgi:hypothetical protein
MRLLRIVLCSALLILAGVAPASAGSKVLLYPTKIDLHFADAKGKVHTLPITLNVEKALINSCTSVDDLMARTIAGQEKPELTVMAYLGSTCRGAKKPSAKGVLQPKLDERPAMVVLTFLHPEEGWKYSVFGRQGPALYQMGTCALTLKKTQASLLKQVQAKHVGQEFRGASCFLRSANYAKFRD